MIFSADKLNNSPELRNQIIETLLDANKAIMHFYKEILLTEKFKDDDSPLTKADIAAHNIT